jgi:hypothetical protein
MKIKTDSKIGEVYDFLRENKAKLASNGPKILAQWNKALRQAKGKETSMLYEFEIDGNPLWHLRHTCGNPEYYYSNLIEVPFAKDKNQYLHWLSSEEDIFKYTSHFFDRYKERMKMKGSTKQAVKQFFKKSASMVCVYWKNDKFVYSMDEGLLLGVADQQLGMKVACTFVDYGLLKPSQKAAFDKVHSVADEIRSLHLDLHRRGVSLKDAAHVVSDKIEDIQKSAEEVYSWYFESGDLVLR